MATVKTAEEELVDLRAERAGLIAERDAARDLQRDVEARLRDEKDRHDATAARLARANDKRNSGSARTRVAAASRVRALIEHEQIRTDIPTVARDAAVLALEKAQRAVEATPTVDSE